MRVLVTGGAGYIGSHTCKALAEAGHVPIAFDNLSTGHRWAVKWGPLIEGDLADKPLICDSLKQYQIEGIIHFAASAYVGESVKNPRKYFENNTINTINLLNAMLDEGIKKIIFSSSCATYGIPDTIPITEEHIQQPINPYGDTKLYTEKILNWYGLAYVMRSVSLRYFNAAGADPEGELGEDHFPETHLIPIVIQAALGKRPSVEIYGTDYPTPDQTAIRDYIHVTDLARAHVQALHYLNDGGKNTAINLGIGQGHSVKDIINCVEQTSGKVIDVRETSRRSGDPAILIADSTRARTILNWVPVYTRLETIIETAWVWNMKNNNLS